MFLHDFISVMYTPIFFGPVYTVHILSSAYSVCIVYHYNAIDCYQEYAHVLVAMYISFSDACILNFLLMHQYASVRVASRNRIYSAFAIIEKMASEI